MTTSYDLDIIANESFVLKLNFSGIKEGETSVDTLKMSIYAYNSSTAKPIFGYSLGIEDIRKLYGHLSGISLIRDFQIQKSGKFVEANEGVIKLIGELESVDSNIIRTIFDKFQEDTRVFQILSVLTEVEAEHLVASHKYKNYRDELDNLITLLEIEKSGGEIVKIVSVDPVLSRYSAGQPELIFQSWIEKNLWIFGVEYIQQYPFREIVPDSDEEGLSVSDLVMQTVDGFLELIELKRPKYDLLKDDKSHHCHRPSALLSTVLGQSLYYLQKLDEYKLDLESKYPDIQILSPRVKIIAGRNYDFSQSKHKALRMLNSNLNHIQIITYDNLVKNGELILSQFENKIEELIDSPIVNSDIVIEEGFIVAVINEKDISKGDNDIDV